MCVSLKDLDGSKDYFKRKVEYVQEQVEKIDKIQMQKTRFLAAVHEVIDMKVAVMKQQAGKALS